ncbi:MAG: hypothetical protein RR056_00045 [Acetivibrio sp.]
MKKRYLIFGIVMLIVITTTACQSKGNVRKTIPIIDNADEWGKTLLADGSLAADLNGDSKDDTIQIEYGENEGSQYIKKFEIVIEDSSNPFILSEYDASFEKLKLFDFDQDKKSELVIMFDTHGAGGQGTHDIYVLWLNSDEIIAKQMKNPTVEDLVDIESTWNIDGIYNIEKIEYKEDIKFLVRQYIWGENGHADTIGDMVSIISFDEEKNSFIVEESWLERAK